MYRTAILAVFLLLSPLGSAASKKSSKPVRPKPASAASKVKQASRSGASKPQNASPTRRGKKLKKGKRSKAAHRRSTGQRVPTAERYKEIQQALIDKGYLSGSATGEWGSDSTEALKRFQKEQNLQSSGKLDSLSLIALGLGPKRDRLNGANGAPASSTSNTNLQEESQ